VNADTLAPWDGMSDDDRSYWEHQARAVRRAVEQGGFKALAADAATEAALPMQVGDQPQPLDDQRLAEIQSLDLLAMMPEKSAAIVSGHLAALLAEVQRLKAELADFSGRVNELESRLCDCEPVREHNDYKRPAFYQHEAHCPVSNPAKEAVS